MAQEFRIQVVVDPTGARRGVDQTDRQLKRVEARAVSVGAALRRAFAFVGGTALIVGGIRTLASFGQEMSTVGAISRATQSEFEALTEEAKRLGIQTRFSATEAAEGMTFLARAGFNAREVLGTIEGTLKLAQAGALGLGEAADIASNVLTGFRLSTAETARVVDVLALAANSSNTTVSQLGQALKFVAPVAAGVGVELEDAVAAISSLSNAGLQASLAGTGLRRVISELESPSKKTSDEIAKLGEQIDRGEISTVGLFAALQNLRDAGVDTAAALEIFGDRGGPAFEVLNSAGADTEEFAKMLRDAGGTADAVAKAMDDNLNGALLATRSAFQGLILELGDAGATGGLRAFLDVLTTGLRGAAANIDQTVRAIEGLAFVLGVSLARRAIPALIVQIKALTVAAAANPFTAILVGATLAGGAIIAFRETLFGTIRDIELLSGAQGDAAEAARELQRAQSDLDIARKTGDIEDQREALMGVSEAIDANLTRLVELNQSAGEERIVPVEVVADFTGVSAEELQRQVTERLGRSLALDLEVSEGASDNLVREINRVLDELPEPPAFRLEFSADLFGETVDPQVRATREELDRLVETTGSAEAAVKALFEAGGLRGLRLSDAVEAADAAQRGLRGELAELEGQAEKTADAVAAAGGTVGTGFSEEVQKGRAALASYLEELRFETEALGLSDDARERAIALRQAEQLAVGAGVAEEEDSTEATLAGIKTREDLLRVVGRLVDGYEDAERAADAEAKAQERASDAARERAGALRGLLGQLDATVDRTFELGDQLSGLSEIEQERARALRAASEAATRSGGGVGALVALGALQAALQRVVDLRTQLERRTAEDAAAAFLEGLREETRLAGLSSDERERAEVLRRAEAAAVGLQGEALRAYLEEVAREYDATRRNAEGQERSSAALRAQRDAYAALTGELAAVRAESDRLKAQLQGLSEAEIQAGQSLRFALDAAAQAGGGPAAVAIVTALAASLEELNRQAADLEGLRAQADLYERLTGPQRRVREDQEALHALLARFPELATTAADGILAIEAAAARASGTVGGGFRAGLLETQRRLNDIAGTAERVVVNAFQSMEDALVKFATTGKFEVSSLVDSIVADLARLLAQQALGALLNLVAPGAGGLIGGTRAEGGPVDRGRAYLVGEEGPELVVPRAAGTVIPAEATRAFLAGAYATTLDRLPVGLELAESLAGSLGSRARGKGGPGSSGGGGFGGAAGGKQSGGAFAGGARYLMGEDGPELVVERPGQTRTPRHALGVVPNGANAAQAGSGVVGGAQAAPVVTVPPSQPVVNTYIVEDESRIVKTIDSPSGEQAVLNIIRRNRDTLNFT